MTEFEMAYLMNDMWIQLIMLTQVFFAVLTAFIVASYLVAHRLTRPMAVVVVGLFLLASLGSILNISRQAQSIVGLAFEMKALALSGRGLAWHAVVNTPEWTRGIAGVPAAVMFLIATAAAVYFFFHCRRVNRRAEGGVWHPKV